MLKYNFLILSLIFLVPGILIFTFRKDLRKMMKILALCSIPFAFTEFLFYPSYWEPIFLFNLIDYIGFGIEDIIFVIGLSAFTSTSYAVFSRKKLVSNLEILPSVYKPLFIIFGICLLLIGSLIYLGIHMIYGAPIIMMIVSIGIFIYRPDLALPGLVGGFSSMLLYGTLCLLLLLIYPSIFSLTWHTEKFLNFAIFGIPIEEMLYGFTSGCIATIFYPFLFQSRFEKI